MLREIFRIVSDQINQIDSSPTKEWQEKLFSAVSNLEDKTFCEALLRLLLRMQLEEFDQNYEEFLRLNFKKPEYGHTRLPISNEKALNYCFDLAELLVDVLTHYSKFNRDPDYAVWETSIPHKQFSEFVNSLFWATRGRITRFFFPHEILEWIDNTYECETYEAYVLPIKYLGFLSNWISEKCPPEQVKDNGILFQWCADLTKYSCIQLPGEPMLDSIGGLETILSWNPQLSLPCLCKSYNHALCEDIFCLDYFRDVVWNISDQLPGSFQDQLIGIYYTYTDTSIRAGALGLMPWEEMDAYTVIKLAKQIEKIESKQERYKYIHLFPTLDEFKNAIAIPLHHHTIR